MIIPFEPMWAAFKRVIKPRGAIVLTASQPFTSLLVCSNLTMFKYQWVWDKNRPQGYANAKLRPLKATEDVCVFGGDNYYPQGLQRVNRVMRNSTWKQGANRNSSAQGGGSFSDSYIQEFTNYPTNVLKIDVEDNTVHPTQKPVALFEYLIRTYTQAGDVVLDCCSGSGTTAIAARNTGRNFICGDTSLEYVEVARKRLAQPFTLPMLLETA